MNSNRITLDALTQEGILMTEEQLLKETQKVQSNGNGSTPAPAKGLMAYNNGTSPSKTAVKAKPGSGRIHEGSAQSRPAASAVPRATVGDQLVTPRSRQRTPEPWLMALLCRMGMHAGPWAYVADDNCSQGRECGRCGSVHSRTRHHRTWQYELEGSCQQMHVCARCAQVDKTRTEHEWWGPTYSVDSEIDAHDCRRCGEVNTWSTASDGD